MQSLAKVEKVVHPMDDESYLHEATRKRSKKVVHTDPLVLAKECLATVFNLRKLTKELREQEATLKQSLHPDVRKCTESKNFALSLNMFYRSLVFGTWGSVHCSKKAFPLWGCRLLHRVTINGWS